MSRIITTPEQNIKMIRKILISIVLLFSSVTVLAVSEDALKTFIEANNAFSRTNYNKSIQLYKKAIGLKFNSGGIYYNLGNAYYQEGKLGFAIASYLKAQRLMPRNADIASNLKTARSQTENKIIPKEINPALKQFLFFYFKFSLDELLWTTAFLFAGIFVALSIYAFVPVAPLKKLIIFITIIFLITSLTSLTKIYNFHTNKIAVVIKEKAIVCAGPDKSYASRIELYDGAELKVLSMENEWIKIQIAKEKGWINRNDVKILQF